MDLGCRVPDPGPLPTACRALSQQEYIRIHIKHLVSHHSIGVMVVMGLPLGCYLLQAGFTRVLALCRVDILRRCSVESRTQGVEEREAAN